MRRLMRMLLIYAAVFIVLPLGVGAYYWTTVQDPSFDKHSVAFHDAVTRISDPEHLKRVVFTVTKEADDYALIAKRTTDSAVWLMVIWLVGAGFAFLHVYSTARKLLKASDGGSKDAL